MAIAPEPLDGVRRPRDRLAGNVQHTVDVEQDGCHYRTRSSWCGNTVGRGTSSLRRNRTRSVAIDGESIRVTRSVSIPRSEIQLRFSRSSGPGGQHAQKTETRVEALFDVEASEALTPTQKRRATGKAGPVLRAVAQDERSQTRNRELATERLVEALRAALRVERRRVATKPSAKARERRLAEKRRRAETKRLRRTTDD